MPRNGNGSYTPPAGNPVIPGTVIESNWANDTINDIAAALTDSISSDGQTIPEANLPMGGFHHTQCSDPTLRNQYLTLGMGQDGRHSKVQITGGPNNLTGILVGQNTNYVDGALLSFIVSAPNTGAVTLDYNGIGPRSVVTTEKRPLVAGDLVPGALNLMYYSQANDWFQLITDVFSQSGITLEQASTTGWIRPASGTYPVLTLPTATTVLIPAGKGLIVPPVRDAITIPTEVEWVQQTISLTYITQASVTTIAVSSTGNITQFPGRVPASSLRNYIVLGVASHVSGVATSVSTTPAIYGDDGYLTKGIGYILTNVLLSGGKVSPNSGAPLSLDISDGIIGYMGGSANVTDRPNNLTLTGGVAVSFYTLAGANTVSVGTTNVAPVASYDPNGSGVITPLPNPGDVTVHRLYYIHGTYVWVYGQRVYSNMTEALTNILVDRTRYLPSMRISDAALVAEILATKTCVNLGTAGSGAIISPGGFNFTIGGAGGIGEAPVDGNTYGRRNATWFQTLSALDPQVTGDVVITKATPKVVEVMNPVSAGFAGLNVKQLSFNWCNLEITHPDDKAYFRSYNPANGALRNTTTWDLATGAWTFSSGLSAPNVTPRTSAVGAANLPVGTTAERPGVPVDGLLRYNSDTPGFEGYSNGEWGQVGGGAINGVFYENSQHVTDDYTITTGKNAMTAGPITVDTGITVTVPDGSVWTVV